MRYEGSNHEQAPKYLSLRLPTSVKAEVVRRAKADGTSFNQFVATAVAEKLAAMKSAEFVLERRDRANYAAFDKIMKRKGGEKPRPEDIYCHECTPLVCKQLRAVPASPVRCS